MQNIVDLARIPLNDDSKTRYDDATLLNYTNRAIQRLIIVRPDLFIGSYLSLPTTALALGDTFPLGAPYEQPVADYVTARAETVDAEFAENSRATSFFALMKETAG